MNICYSDHGAVATITLTSTVFEFRKHNRCVDAALLYCPVRAHRSGFFFLKSVITGGSAAMLRAYKIIGAEDAR